MATARSPIPRSPRLQGRSPASCPPLSTLAALVPAAAAFWFLDGPIALLYTGAVLVAVRVGSPPTLLFMALVCGVPAFASLLLQPTTGDTTSDFDLGLCLVALATVVLLEARSRAGRARVAELAALLDMTHDSIIVRDAPNRITYWNDGSRLVYGWRRDEALGRRCCDLLGADPAGEEIGRELSALRNWSGALVRVRRDGTRVSLASRMRIRSDARGRYAGLVETSAHVGVGSRPMAARSPGEQRSDVGLEVARVVVWKMGFRPIFEPDGSEVDTHSALPRSRPCGPADIGLLTSDGWMPSRVLHLATPSHSTGAAGEPMRLLGPASFVPIESGRNQAAVEPREASQFDNLRLLTASIVHEVNQPLSAIRTYGQTAQRWLDLEAPDACEVRDCLQQIVDCSGRVSDVIDSASALFGGARPRRYLVCISDLIRSALSQVGQELETAGVTLRHSLRDQGPSTWADEVQIRQVVTNLVLNGVQAMTEVVPERRELKIFVDIEQDWIQVSVRDSGRGIAPELRSRLFQPFVSTKRDGLGLGLPICRWIVEAHEGRIWAEPNEAGGMTFKFSLPVASAEA